MLLNVRTTFHNDLVLFYMTYFNGEWSPPMELGRSTITSWSEANVKLISVENKSQMEPTIWTYVRPSPSLGLRVIRRKLPIHSVTDVRCGPKSCTQYAGPE